MPQEYPQRLRTCRKLYAESYSRKLTTKPMPRVAGTDPGTSSLDVVVLDDDVVTDQVRFSADQIRADATSVVQWLEERRPFDRIAGPSGYGLPLVHREDCGAREQWLMSLTRDDERGHPQGVSGFRRLIHELCNSTLPIVFLPGVIHLPTVPMHRKINRIDLGTADKVCVAALANHFFMDSAATYCLVELGSAFTACLIVRDGAIVDGAGGTFGPVGWRCGGAWDGELAYLMSPLKKEDLFHGGASECGDLEVAQTLLCESLLKTVAGLRAATPFELIVVSGRLLQQDPDAAARCEAVLRTLAEVQRLPSMPGAWVKHAAQGAALIADGLASGSSQIVADMALNKSTGTVLDWVRHPRMFDVKLNQ